LQRFYFIIFNLLICYLFFRKSKKNLLSITPDTKRTICPEKNNENDKSHIQLRTKTQFSHKNTSSDNVSNLLQNKSIDKEDNKKKRKILFYKNQDSGIFTPINQNKNSINKKFDYYEKTMDNNPTDYSNLT